VYRGVTILCEVRADHEGWEAEVEEMDRRVAYLFRGLEHDLTRCEFHHPREDQVLQVGCETSSSTVVKKAVKLGWISAVIA